jgi:hypothetical protein
LRSVLGRPQMLSTAQIANVQKRVTKAATVAAKNPSPFWLALTGFMAALVFTTNNLIGENTGVSPLFSLATSLPVLAKNLSAVTQYLAEALGTTLPLPLVHLAVLSFFKSMRNPTSRRRIFMGWPVVSILTAMFCSFSGSDSFSG